MQTGCVRGSIPRGGVTSLRAHKAEISGGVIATESRANQLKILKKSGKVMRRFVAMRMLIACPRSCGGVNPKDLLQYFLQAKNIGGVFNQEQPLL